MVAAVKPPAYQEFHESASVLVGRFRNEGALASLPPKTHFAWIHRFYLILDEVATQHKVFKLYGGPQGFLLATNVAEPDADHAITLLTCALKLLNRAEHIRVPGGAPLDLTLALDSGPLASGLLGSTSLTYQVVGRSLAVAEELAEHETQVPFLVADGMHRFLPAAAAAGLIPLGAVQLRCSRDEAVPVYTLPQYNGLPLDHAAPAALGIPMRLPDHAPVTAESALGAPTPLASDQGDRLASLSLRSDSQGDGSAPNSNKGAAVPAA